MLKEKFLELRERILADIMRLENRRTEGLAQTKLLFEFCNHCFDNCNFVSHFTFKFVL